jgi:actin-related protein 8
VKIGDQTTSISCVEDGISHQNTRVCLKMAGSDVTQTFYWLLKKCSFPYKDCQPQILQDAMLLTQLKENFCHVDLNVCGSQVTVLF